VSVWERSTLEPRELGVGSMTWLDYVDLRTGSTSFDALALYRNSSVAIAAESGAELVPGSRVCHIDEGFDFLGWRIQRRSWRGRTGKKAVYTYPSKKALASVMAKVRSLTRRSKHRRLADLLISVNRVLRGWCNYFRHGVSSKTFGYLDHFTWWRIFGWLRKRHAGLNKGTLVRRYLPAWKIRDGHIEMFRPRAIAIERYRYRGARIPTPWAVKATGSPAPAA
jgi:RNA-directed DNA polymerase